MFAPYPQARGEDRLDLSPRTVEGDAVLRSRFTTRWMSFGMGLALAASAAALTGPPSQAEATQPGSACAVPSAPGSFQDDTGLATMTVTAVSGDCLRTYKLVSVDRTCRSDQSRYSPCTPAGERVFSEKSSQAILRSGSVLLDGLYAMAHDDAALNETDQVTDAAYNNGNPVPCGGCYITGEFWTYVWTRDVSYSADLGLTAADPERMRNTLLFKLSDRRDGSGDTQVIQDTGTGGSYPNSTDRVVWALGASEIIDWLPDGQRQEFAARAYEAIRNTSRA